MPIRINLLAEAQALEELRRRDPVKRAVWTAAVLAVGLLSYSGYLQTRAMVAKSELNRLEEEVRKLDAPYKLVKDNKRKLDDANLKLTKLLELATNRFLNGTVLDALQHTTVDDVQLIHLKTEHRYIEEEIKTKPAAEAVVSKAPKPTRVKEDILLTLDGRDNSGGEQWSKFKAALAGCSYFQSMLGKTNEVKLTNLTPAAPGVNFVEFKLECRYPEKTR